MSRPAPASHAPAPQPVPGGRSDPPGRVACCIAGCGPAGAMLGLLLARAGVAVLVLEKHADFLRDFRGDTIHPSTLEILNELGLAERFLSLPHTEVRQLTLQVGRAAPLRVDFERLGRRTRFPFIGFVPQWDFLRFVTQEAQRYPGFSLLMQAEAYDLLRADGRVQGVRYRTPGGERTVQALLTVGADGRGSATRARAGLPRQETSPPMDVLWFRLSRRPDEPHSVDFSVANGQVVGLIDRRAYWQVAWVIPKGGFDRVRQAGLDAFRGRVAGSLPSLADRAAELASWDDVKLLTVRSDRLRQWYRPGYLAIGDAAHAMSPIGGVGINVAIQDAVEAANVLWRPLRAGRLDRAHLARVQLRREPSVRLTQAAQTLIQDRLLRPTLSGDGGFELPRFARLLLATPGLRDLPARFLAFGVFRPRVRSPQADAP